MDKFIEIICKNDETQEVQYVILNTRYIKTIIPIDFRYKDGAYEERAIVSTERFIYRTMNKYSDILEALSVNRIGCEL